jgi:tRNA(fMet)-specific endonuclease VapC
MKLVLDTHIYCDYAEGVPEVVEVMAQHGEFLYIPSIVLGELYYGFLKGNREQFNERKLRQVITRLSIEIIGVDSEVARKYGLIYCSLEKKGAKIPINDVWIGACCMNVGGTLLTRDKHFTLIDQIDTMILRG